MWLNTLPKGILFTSYGHEELYIYTMLLCAGLSQDQQFPSKSNYIRAHVSMPDTKQNHSY
jgi:hypothetical protein